MLLLLGFVAGPLVPLPLAAVLIIPQNYYVAYILAKTWIGHLS
jgi:hypothetical protein